MSFALATFRMRSGHPTVPSPYSHLMFEDKFMDPPIKFQQYLPTWLSRNHELSFVTILQDSSKILHKDFHFKKKIKFTIFSILIKLAILQKNFLPLNTLQEIFLRKLKANG